MSIFRQLEPTRRATKGSAGYSRCCGVWERTRNMYAFYKRMHDERRKPWGSKCQDCAKGKAFRVC